MALRDVGARLVLQGEGAYTAGMERADRATAGVGRSAVTSGQQMRQGFALGGAAAAAMLIPFVLAERAAREFESSFAGVKKTVDGTDAELAALAQGFRDMALVIPINVNELNRIGEAAGQLGVKKQNIQEFTKVIAEMAVATNLTAEEASTSMARLANILQLPQEQFRNLGSAVVDLGNNSASTESDILNMSLRLAGAGSVIGLTTPQILGIATALSDVGIEAEAGGSAFSRVFYDMNSAVADGGEKLEVFAAVSGKTVAEFSQQFKTDAAGAITAFVGGLGNVIKSGANVDAVLKNLELSEVRTRDALVRSAQAGDTLAASMDRGTRAFGEATASADEANKAYATTESKLILARSAMNDAAITLGTQLQPAELEVTKALTGFIKEALVPLVDEYGPRLGSFLAESVRGWTSFAVAIRTDAIPSLGEYIIKLREAENANYSFMDTVANVIIDIGLASIEMHLALDESTAASRANARAFDESIKGMQRGLAVLTDEQARARIAAVDASDAYDALAAAVVATGDAADEADPKLRAYRAEIERLLAAQGRGGGGGGGGTSARGAAIREIDLAAEATRALADAERDAADAAREAADAERERAAAIAEAARQAQLAREAIVTGIIAEAGLNRAGVALRNPGDPEGNLQLGVEALRGLTAAGRDTSVALALVDASILGLSAKLAQLTGDELAEAGALMKGLHDLRAALAEGSIGAEEFAAGVGQLTGRLGELAGKVDAAAKEAADAVTKAVKEALERQQELEREWAETSKALWREVRDTRIEIFQSATAAYLDGLNREVAASIKAEQEKYEAVRRSVDAQIREGQRLEDAENQRLRARDRQRLLQFVEVFAPDQLANAHAFAGNSQDALARAIMQIASTLAPSLQIGNVPLGDLLTRLGGSVSLPSSFANMAALPAGTGGGNGESSGGTTINVNASYTDPQEPQALRYDLESILMQLQR